MNAVYFQLPGPGRIFSRALICLMFLYVTYFDPLLCTLLLEHRVDALLGGGVMPPGVLCQ